MPDSAPTRATLAGTRRFAEKFPACLAAGHFRQHQSLLLSSLGIGTYLGEPDARTDAAYIEAVVAAVSSGVNVIDTAINYRFQRSERSIGAALQQLASLGFTRDEIFLCTKGGYLTPDGAMPSDPGRYFLDEYVQRGVLRMEDVAAGIHCMSPTYLQDQLARSLRNLGVSCIDVYYLHNPETQLSAVPRAEFHARLRSAFLFLESAVNAGQIRAYGLSTWNAFRVAPNSTEFISLEETVRLAREAAGAAHHFRFVQMPFNLAMPEAFAAANQPLDGTPASTTESAAALGITLIASASLLQSQLTRNLPPVIGDVLGLDSDLLRALQFARSAPGIATALVGMSRRAHVEENLRLASAPSATPDQFRRLFR